MGLRIAIFGQAPFGRDVAEGLAAGGHQVVGVYAPPDGRRPDPLAALAEECGWPLFRHRRFRRKGVAIPELVDEYRALGAELNVMPFTTAILPPEIVDPPLHGSLCFHPSLLPAYRGGAALAWQIILGATEAGVTVFKVEGGVDEGPIVVQRGGVAIDDTDTTAARKRALEETHGLGNLRSQEGRWSRDRDDVPQSGKHLQPRSHARAR